MLPDTVHAAVDTSSWQQGSVFDWLQEKGSIATDEMRRTFNCGVGMIVAVSADDADAALKSLEAAGERAWRIGEVVEGEGPVEYR